MSKTVIFYRTTDGTCPVQEFLDSLPAKAAQRVTWVLSLIEDLDMVPSTYFKKLVGSDGIWECRMLIGCWGREKGTVYGGPNPSRRTVAIISITSF